jgi:mono/diheme cytochrome c family protein
MPKPLIYILVVLSAITLVPLAYLALMRSTDQPVPRIQVVYDMDTQPRAKAQTVSDFFSDGHSARRFPEGTVAQNEAATDDAYAFGKQDTTWITHLPVPITREMLTRGRERFDIFCASCHGRLGDGKSLVHQRASSLGEGTWTPPADITAKTTVDRPSGELFDIISNGVRNMPAYGPQIPVADRWAVVAYLRALQRAANGQLEDVPVDRRNRIQ